ncbi:DUF4893 domain-containing protein [Sphingomonas sp. HMWF008]|nr:DUF4893 domain-containing protein [Sphingomonas sp. HMWF008]
MNHLTRVLGSALCALTAPLIAGCAAKSGKRIEVRIAPSRPATPGSESVADWRRVATAADRIRLRGWRQAWVDALAKVTAPDELAVLRADPLLFDPDRALPTARLEAGPYRCRVFKLGANGTAMRNMTSYPAVDCMVKDEGDVSSLYKVSGAQRPVGLIFPDSDSRGVFLGTMVLGDETKPLKYGQDTNRDLAGYIERIGPRRWRLVLPQPRFESLLDVVEIVPKS